MSVLVDGRKNGYEVVTGGYRTQYIPVVDGTVTGVNLFKLPKDTFVTQVVGINGTDADVVVNVGGTDYTVAAGDSAVDVNKSFKDEALVTITSASTTGECVFVLQTVEYNRVQGTRTSMRV